MADARRALAFSLYDAAVAAASAASCVPQNLPPAPPSGRLILFGAGKGGADMVRVAIRHYLAGDPDLRPRLGGVAVTRYGYGCETDPLACREAGHPLPDAASVSASGEMLTLAKAATKDDLVVVLLSGGASANLTYPAPGLTLADKQAVSRALLRSGADINEINTVRRHLSQIKGGKLAAAVFPAKLVTLAISDVPGDAPAAIGSGPTVGDPTTLADARAVVEKYRLALPEPVMAALRDPANETLKPGDPVFAGSTYRIIATARDSLAAAAKRVAEAGYEPIMLGDRVTGEARELGAAHAAMARELAAAGRRAAIISGGECTVTVVGNGKGGPNQEYALGLAVAIEGDRRIVGIAGDTDGTDGGAGLATDPAGAFVDATSAARARAIGRDPAKHLANNDSTALFDAIGDLVNPGPTRTNVSDFRAVLVDPAM
ncbi:MAG: glycerate kinase type-2 family protein [Bauldia sp.]